MGMTNTETNRVIDCGNNQTWTIGCFAQPGGIFLAMTFTASKEFKTRAAAEKWLAKRGYGPRGEAL